MRILHVIREMDPKTGGPPRVVEGLAVASAQAGHDVEIAAIGTATAQWPRLSQNGVKLNLFEASPPGFLGGSAGLSNFVNRVAGRFDVIHVHGVWDKCLRDAGQAAQREGKPLLISVHGMLDPWSMRRSRLKKTAALHLLGVRSFLDNASAIFCGTADEAAKAEPLHIRAPIGVLANGYAPLAIGPGSRTSRERLNATRPKVADWSRIILFYSRIHPKKGVDLLVEAFAQIAQRFPDTGLLVAGIAQDAAYAATIEARIESLGLGSRIDFTTDLTGTDSLFVLQACDIFALPSHQEGFSMAVVEAMACGKPVLVTDQCHVNEISSWRAGVVVPVSVEGLVSGLAQLLALDDTALEQTGARGRAIALEQFSWPAIAARLHGIYAQAIDRKRHGSR